MTSTIDNCADDIYVVFALILTNDALSSVVMKLC